MNKAQKGFTLIELMIVIAIIGILAAIAIPQYQDYVTRSKITEGLNLAAAPETAVTETYQSLGHVPASSNTADPNSFGLPIDASITGKYVVKVNTAATTGAITITYDAAVGGGVTTGMTLQLMPGIVTGGASGSQGGIPWACGYGTITVAGSAFTGTAGTTVPAKYLPANCRG